MHTKKKILIIEDEPILGELLSTKFAAEGYAVSWERDGEAGLAKISDDKPDLILLDIVMPKKDGYQVLEEMQRDSLLKRIPVIVISNSGQPVEIKRILKMGVKDYIVKAEFSPVEVLEKVRGLLGDEEAPAKRGNGKKSARNGGKGKILIVEDDPFLSSITVNHLEEKGHTVTVATDGEQALAQLEKDVPDLVLLDIVMPGLNGFEVLKRIKTDERLKRVSVVMFSNLGQEHEIEEATSLGADAFLVKAKFTPREVLAKVEELLAKKSGA
jgi:DNA-binding response OmpR family regulator